MRKPADKVIAPVLLDNPVPSHADIIPKTRLLYQFYCINKLRPFIPHLVFIIPRNTTNDPKTVFIYLGPCCCGPTKR